MNKYIIVTGASSGIGKAVALACNAKGYHVIVVGRDERKLFQLHSEATYPTHIYPIAVDITEYSNLIKIKAAIPEAAKLTCLFHSAAVIEPWGRITPDSEEFFYHNKTNISAAKVLTMLLMSKMDADSSALFIGSYFGDRSSDEIEKLKSICEAYLNSKTQLVREVIDFRHELLPNAPAIIVAKPGRVAGTGIYEAFWKGKKDPNPTITPQESAEFLLWLTLGEKKPTKEECSGKIWDIQNEGDNSRWKEASKEYIQYECKQELH